MSVLCSQSTMFYTVRRAHQVSGFALQQRESKAPELRQSHVWARTHDHQRPTLATTASARAPAQCRFCMAVSSKFVTWRARTAGVFFAVMRMDLIIVPQQNIGRSRCQLLDRAAQARVACHASALSHAVW